MRLGATKTGATTTYNGLGDQLYDLGGARPTLDLNFASNESLVDSVTGKTLVTHTRASNATYVDGDGVIQTAANNVARFDHNPTTGESLGLLIEEERTNLITNSNLLSDFSPTVGGNVFTTVTETAPDNGTQVGKLSPVSANTRCRLKFTASSSNNVAFSVFVKKDTHRYVQIGYGGGSNNFAATFDIEPGVTNRLISQGGDGTYTNIDAGYQDYPNGWVKIWAVGTTIGTQGPGINFIEDDTKTSFGDSNVFDGTESIYVWGAQYEDNKSFPTSYIPTSGSTVTRSADVASITGTNFSSWYNQTEGTVFANYGPFNAPSSGINPGVWSLNNTTNSTNLIEFFNGSVTAGVFRVRSASSSEAYINSNGTLSPENQNKMAAVYKQNDFARSLNGLAVGTDTTGNLPSVSPTFLNIGSINAYGVAPLNGPISRLTYWPTRLSNNTLQTITK